VNCQGTYCFSTHWSVICTRGRSKLKRTGDPPLHGATAQRWGTPEGEEGQKPHPESRRDTTIEKNGAPKESSDRRELGRLGLEFAAGAPAMIIVHGIYRFKPKRVAFRNDFCLTCKQPRRAQQIRTFDVVHLYWIPLIPLGLRKPWFCLTCGKRPYDAPGTSRVFKWIGLVLLILFTPLFLLMPPDPKIPTAVMWLLRVAPPIGAVLTVMHLMKTPKDLRRKEELAKVPLANDTACPFCGTHLLLMMSQTSCPKCGVVRA
jgi:hypothetical protein